jgi:hypothetical protein
MLLGCQGHFIPSDPSLTSNLARIIKQIQKVMLYRRELNVIFRATPAFAHLFTQL